MTIEQLAREWQATEVKHHTQDELISLLHDSHVPLFRKLNRRLTIELMFTVLLFGAGLMINGWISVPVWLVSAVGGCATVFLFRGLLRYFFLEKSSEKNLHLLMFDFGKSLKRALLVSRYVNVALSVVMLAMLGLRTESGVGVYEWPFLVPVLFSLMAVASRKHLRKLIVVERMFNH